MPLTVTLPAGQTTAVFNLNAVNNTLIDGNQSVTIAVGVENWTSGSSLHRHCRRRCNHQRDPVPAPDCGMGRADPCRRGPGADRWNARQLFGRQPPVVRPHGAGCSSDGHDPGGTDHRDFCPDPAGQRIKDGAQPARSPRRGRVERRHVEHLPRARCRPGPSRI